MQAEDMHMRVIVARVDKGITRVSAAGLYSHCHVRPYMATVRLPLCMAQLLVIEPPEECNAVSQSSPWHQRGIPVVVTQRNCCVGQTCRCTLLASKFNMRRRMISVAAFNVSFKHFTCAANGRAPE